MFVVPSIVVVLVMFVDDIVYLVVVLWWDLLDAVVLEVVWFGELCL